MNDSDKLVAEVSTESPRGETAPPRRMGFEKPGRSGPPGNRNAAKHGLYAGDARRIDMRTRADRAVFQTLRAIEDDLADLSTAKRVILDGVGRKLRDLFKLEEYLTSVSIVNKRTRSLIPVVVEKHRLLESIRRDLETLGLERRARQAVTLESIAAEYAAMATSTATPDNTPVATRPQQEPPTPSDASTGGANR